MPDYIVHKAIDLDKLSTKAKAETLTSTYLISPKYDGCHVIFLFVNGDLHDVLSRTGERVISMNHVAEDLKATYDLGKGRIAICGEAWIPGQEFSDISGLFRRQYAVPDLKFVPFDCVPWDAGSEVSEGIFSSLPRLGQYNEVPYRAPYIARVKGLLTRKPIVTSVMCPVFLDCEVGKLEEKATTQALHYKALGGYDGVVAARADGVYKVGSGRGGEFIKFKPLLSESLVVVAVEPAIGVKTGKHTCSLVVTYNGRAQRVSTGLMQREINEYVSTPESIIGKTIEVEAMGITTTGLLREPRYKGIRTDVI